MSNEADTYRKYVLPKLIKAGWDDDPHSFTEQRTFTDGRIVVSGNKIHAKRGNDGPKQTPYERRL